MITVHQPSLISRSLILMKTSEKSRRNFALWRKLDMGSVRLWEGLRSRSFLREFYSRFAALGAFYEHVVFHGATGSSLDDATIAVPCLDSMRWSRIDGTTLQSGVVQPSVTRIDVAINCEIRSFGDFLVTWSTLMKMLRHVSDTFCQTQERLPPVAFAPKIRRVLWCSFSVVCCGIFSPCMLPFKMYLASLIAPSTGLIVGTDGFSLFFLTKNMSNTESIIINSSRIFACNIHGDFVPKRGGYERQERRRRPDHEGRTFPVRQQAVRSQRQMTTIMNAINMRQCLSLMRRHLNKP